MESSRLSARTRVYSPRDPGARRTVVETPVSRVTLSATASRSVGKPAFAMYLCASDREHSARERERKKLDRTRMPHAHADAWVLSVTRGARGWRGHERRCTVTTRTLLCLCLSTRESTHCSMLGSSVAAATVCHSRTPSQVQSGIGLRGCYGMRRPTSIPRFARTVRNRAADAPR